MNNEKTDTKTVLVSPENSTPAVPFSGPEIETKPKETLTKSPASPAGGGAKKIDFSQVKKENLKKPSIKTNDIDDFLSEYRQAATVIEPGTDNSISMFQKEPTKRGRKPKQEKMFISGDIISGALFITLIDLVIPMAIVTLNNTLDSSNKIDINDLRLKASQRKELEPIADELMKQIELKANPIVIMLISLVSIYGLNFVNVKYSLD